MSDTHDNDIADIAPQASPGDMLKRERERQGMSQEAVATALNLRPAVVRGMESDNYDEVPVAAYRRGYLRAYSRLLDVDDKPIIAAYNTRFGSTESERKVTPVHVTKPPSRLGAWLFKLFTVLVVVALIALTLLWWQSRGGTDMLGLGGSEPVTVDTLDGTTITEGEDGSLTAGETLPPLPDDESDMGLVDDAPLGEPVDEPAAPVESDVDDTPTVFDSGAFDDSVDNTADTAPPAEAAPLDDEAASEASDDIAETDDTANDEAVDEAGPRVLELTFNEQSWTEIFDAGNQRVFFGLQEPGTQATVEGEPPFRLTVGNATGVVLRYQGDDVDLASYAGSNNVARFTLGE